MKLWPDLLLGLWAFFTLTGTGVSQKAIRPKLVCYTETWAITRNSPMDYDLDSSFPPNMCDYLILMYLTLDPANWTLKMHNGYTTVEPEDLRKGVRAREKNPGMKVLLSVGGWEDGVAKWSAMISESPNRKAFVNSVVQVLEEYNLDGLELHWLYPGAVWRGGKAGDKANFLQLVKELTKAFKSKRWILTASVPPDRDNLLKGYYVRRLSSFLHHLNVRTFDMRGDWNGAADVHSPLYSRPNETQSLRHLNVNDSISMWLANGASRRKLVATFCLFGRSFTLKNPAENKPGSPTIGPGKITPFVGAPGIMAYYEICDEIQLEKLKSHFIVSSQTPYAVEGDQWVGYDDENSLQKKIKFVRDQGLAGAALYPISLDDFTGKCGESHFLLKKTNEYLRANSRDLLSSFE